jgi:TonB-dependent receptor
MRLRILALATAVLATQALASPAFAQNGRSTLTGTITDAGGGSLQGARVTVDPGALTTVSNSVGTYTLTGLPSGTYTLTIAYSGFATSTQTVTLAAGQATRSDASLKVADASASVDVIAGRAGGEVEAINRTLTADNIIQVLPADVITSLPNANIADAIGRLPSVTLERDEGEGKYVQIRGTEPRLTNTTLDGVNIASAETVRQVKLDIIPADLVESVQINKTLQANMPGDGIGGSVDLRTKSAEDRPTIALDGSGGYTPILGGRGQYQFDGTLGQRFFTGKKLGILGGLTYDWNGRGINDVEPGPFYLGGYDQREYRYYRSRFGTAGTIDYRFNDSNSIYLKGLYALFHNYGDRTDYNQSLSFNSDYSPVPNSGSVGFGAELRRPVQDLGSIQLGGDDLIKSLIFHWDLETSIGRTRDEGYDDAGFKNGNAYNFTVDNSNPLIPKLNSTNGNVYDPTQFYLSTLRVNNYYNPEVDLGLGASLAIPYSAGGHASTIEVGGRFRNVHKFANQDTEYFVPTVSLANKQDASLQLTKFVDTSFSDPNYYGGNYTYGNLAVYDQIKTVPTVQDPKHTNQVGQNFNYLEKVGAGYVMNTTNLGRYRIVAGLRLENTNQLNAGTVGTGTTSQSNGGSYLDVLPSVSVRYSLSPAAGLRVVYSRGVARPNFSDLVSFASIAPGGVRTTSSVGNPNEKAEHADNFDLLYERSLNHQGLIQAGTYYKRLTDPIIVLTSNIGTLATPNIQSKPTNAGDAYVYGFEIAFQQHFAYLPGLLNGLGLSANYGYSDSQLHFPAQVKNVDGSFNIDRTDHPQLARQAPHTWNISPTYDKKALSVRLGLSYNAANIFSYNYADANANSAADEKTPAPFDPSTGLGGGYGGPNGDQYLYSHLQVDLQGSYSLPMGFQVVAYGLNLSNEVFGFYQGSTQYSIQREFYKPSFGGGLRWSPHRNR